MKFRMDRNTGATGGFRWLSPRNQDSQLIAYDSQSQFNRLQKFRLNNPPPRPDRRSLVVHIDGGCRNNGNGSVNAGYGVWFGPHSEYNRSGQLNPNICLTNNLAELEALNQALCLIQTLVERNALIRRVKIVTDSEWLVNSLTVWMPTWLDNGGIRPSGQPVIHWEKLNELYNKMDNMENRERSRICFELWHVTREQNRDADRLANQAMNQNLTMD